MHLIISRVRRGYGNFQLLIAQIAGVLEFTLFHFLNQFDLSFQNLYRSISLRNVTLSQNLCKAGTLCTVHIFWMHPLTQVFFESITQLGNFSFIESVALKNIIMHFEIANFNFTHREFEYFEYVYSNPFLNCSMVAVYLLGVVSCFGLRLVSWLEQSGQAGPWRMQHLEDRIG